MRFARALDTRGLSIVAAAVLVSLVTLPSCKKIEDPVGSEHAAVQTNAEKTNPQSKNETPLDILPEQDRWTEERVFLSEKSADQGITGKLLPNDIKSVLRTDKALKYGEFLWNDDAVPDGKLQVQVDLRRQLVSAYRGGHEVGTAVILFGAVGNDTPLGRFPVKRKSREYYSKSYNNAPMPFSLWLTDDGVALHGSDVKWGAGTHGCVGVPVEFAELVFEDAEVGDVVEILRSPRL